MPMMQKFRLDARWDITDQDYDDPSLNYQLIVDTVTPPVHGQRLSLDVALEHLAIAFGLTYVYSNMSAEKTLAYRTERDIHSLALFFTFAYHIALGEPKVIHLSLCTERLRTAMYLFALCCCCDMLSTI